MTKVWMFKEGQVLFRPDGLGTNRILYGDETCVCCGCLDCSYCDSGTSPCEILAESDGNIHTCSATDSDGNFIEFVGDPNESATLVQRPDLPCVYEATMPTLRIKITPSGGSPTEYPMTHRIFHRYLSSAQSFAGIYYSGPALSFVAYAFYKVGTSPGSDCSVPLSLLAAHNTSCLESISSGFLGWGGTVTYTPL